MLNAELTRSKQEQKGAIMKKALSALLFVCLMAGLTVQAGALEYTIDAPGDPDYGKPTSIEPVITADGGAAVNEDRSKNAALIPPAFGSPSAYTLNTGTYLTPNLAPGGMAATGAVINGGTAAVVTPGTPVTSSPPSTGRSSSSGTVGYTEVTEDLYYSGGYLATLKIPALDLSVKVFQGTDSADLRKGVGHFEETSVWSGNVALAAHNRGTNDYFGEIHTLDIGLAGIEVYDILRDEYDIQVEFGDLGNILAYVSVGDRVRDLERLVSALQEIRRRFKRGRGGMLSQEYISPQVAATPQEAFYAEKESLPLKESAGRVCSEFVMCYPPGIPILAPGERITPGILEYIDYAKEKGCSLTGPEDLEINRLNVLKNPR